MAQGKTLFVFSEKREFVPPVFSSGLFEGSWKENFQIEGVFIPWSNAVDLKQKFLQNQFDEVVQNFNLMLNLPTPALPTLSADERLCLISPLSQYDKLGYDGAARKPFLLTIGFEEAFAASLELGAETPYRFAVSFVAGLMNLPDRLPLILDYLEKDPTYPEMNKQKIKPLLDKFGRG